MKQVKNLPAPRRTLDRRIVGTPEHVRDTIRLIQSSGRLVHASPWNETPEGVQCTVRILDRAPTPAPARRRRWPVVAAGSVGLTVLGVAGYALVQLVNAVIAAFPFIVGGLLLLALVSLLAGSRSRTFSGTFTGRMD